MTETSTKQSRTGILFAVALAMGIVAGAYWHTPLLRMVGVSPSSPGAQASGGQDGANASPSHQLWTCGMHPQVIQDHPGKCPICHMDLTPMDSGGASSGAGGGLRIDPAVMQNMGVRFADATQGVLQRTVRAYAKVLEPETGMSDVNIRVSGWIRKLYADTEGMEIKKGEPLFDLYSPDLSLAIEELIAARKAAASEDAGSAETGGALLSAAKARLVSLDLTSAQVEELAKLDSAPAVVTFLSPASGTLVEKDGVFVGASVSAGQRVLRIASRETMWIEGAVPESSFSDVRIGQSAQARVDALPGQTFDGPIIFVRPRLDEMTRTATIRMAAPNPEGVLRQGMYATISIDVGDTQESVLVPREAVIDTGETQFVFVGDDVGHITPRQVAVGKMGDGGLVQITQGLNAGERVVASGQFLLDSESRWREAITKFLEVPAGQAPNGAAAPASRSPVASHLKVDAARIDAVVLAYLPLAETLGAEQNNDTPLDCAALVKAINDLTQSLDDPKAEALVSSLAKASEAMKGQPLDAQRKLFQPLSAAMINLVDACLPSKAVGESLYVVNCPMVKADWLQRTQEVANPYYANSMKECGSVVRPVMQHDESGGK